MMEISAAVEGAFSILARTSIDVAVLVLVIGCVQVATVRLLSPRLRYGLWLLVVLRLLVPIPISLPGGGTSILASTHTIRSESTPLSTDQPQGIRENTLRQARPIQRESLGEGLHSPIPSEVEGPSVRSAHPPIVLPQSFSTKRASSDSLIDWRIRWSLTLVWLMGVVLSFGFWIRAERRFARTLKKSLPVEDPVIQSLLGQWSQRMGVRRRIRLVQSRKVSSPAIYGLWNIRLILPMNWEKTFTSDDLESILAHELSHVRRGDLYLNVLLTMMNCVYWFHPLVRIALSRLRDEQDSVRDMDALAMRGALEPKHYAATLLSTVQLIQDAERRPQLLGFARSHLDVKRRILAVLNYHKKNQMAAALGGIIIAMIGWIFLTSAAKGDSLEKNQSRPDAESIKIYRTGTAQANWRDSIGEQLSREIEVSFNRVAFEEATDFLGKVMGLNIVLSSGFQDDWGGDCEVTLHAKSMSIENVLGALCKPRDLSYIYTDGVLFIGRHHYEVAEPAELRFYAIDERIRGEDDVETDGRSDAMQDLVRDCVTPRFFEEAEFETIRYWDGLLCLTHTDDGHKEVVEFLESVFELRDTEATVPSWEPPLRESLEEKIDSIAFEDEEIPLVLEKLGLEWRVPLIMNSDLDGETLTLKLSNVSRRTALDWIARKVDGYVVFTDGCVELSRSPATVRRFYRLTWPFPEGNDEAELHIESLIDLIRSTVSPHYWDGYARIRQWDRTLIIDSDVSSHAKIRGLLNALEQAFSSDR